MVVVVVVVVVVLVAAGTVIFFLMSVYVVSTRSIGMCSDHKKKSIF
jgi:hypothetical protein